MSNTDWCFTFCHEHYPPVHSFPCCRSCTNIKIIIIIKVSATFFIFIYIKVSATYFYSTGNLSIQAISKRGKSKNCSPLKPSDFSHWKRNKAISNRELFPDALPREQCPLYYLNMSTLKEKRCPSMYTWSLSELPNSRAACVQVPQLVSNRISRSLQKYSNSSN